MSQLTACPVCGCSHYRDLYRYEHSKWIPGTVVSCADCGAMWKFLLHPEKPVGEYYDDAYVATDYWEQEKEAITALQNVLVAMVRTVGAGPKSLLDVGCGPGVFLSLAQEAGYQVAGVELNEQIAQRARQRTNAEVLTGDLLTMDMAGRKFDVITLLDLIEHVPDPVVLLKRCRELLNPGGHVVLYTPNHKSLIVRVARMLNGMTFGRVSRPVAEIFDGVHVVFFDGRSLSEVLKKAGLPAVSTTRLKYDPARSGQAQGVAALATRAIEKISPLVNGQFRLLMIGRKDEQPA